MRDPRRSAGGAPSTLYVGTVSAVNGTTVNVIIPELGGPAYAYGPARTPDSYDPAATAGPTRPLAVGDAVLVGLLASRTGTRDVVVVLSRLA